MARPYANNPEKQKEFNAYRAQWQKENQFSLKFYFNKNKNPELFEHLQSVKEKGLSVSAEAVRLMLIGLAHDNADQ